MLCTGVNKMLIYMHVGSINVLYIINSMNDRIDNFSQQECSHILTWENSTV